MNQIYDHMQTKSLERIADGIAYLCHLIESHLAPQNNENKKENEE